MTMFHKLYKPLCFWYQFHKFHGSSCFLSTQISNIRERVPVHILIAENVNTYNKISKGNLSNAEWQSIREKCLQIKQITPVTVDSMIIDMCIQNFQVDNGITYFKFLRENNYPLNVAVIGKYLRLYVLKCNSLTDADKMEIVETYNDLKKKHPHLDYITAEYCVTSLCLTNQWEKTHEIIETTKITTTPSTIMYSTLAGAAFRNRKPDIAWNALSAIALRKIIPQDIAYTSHLQYCELEGAETFDDKIEEMFKFWAEYSMMPYNRIISMYADTAKKYGWSVTPTTFSETGSCSHCDSFLSKITFSEESFQKLAESVMNRIIIGSDIYRKTNPSELQRFKRFVEKTKPYDIVIDGLNTTLHNQRNSMPTAQEPTVEKPTLVKVIEFFKKRGKRILVLTRRHQQKLPIFKYVQKHALVFLINNSSDDDPYILYATMISGRNAMFVSKDLMRQHKHSLKNLYLQREFKRWQYSHQYFVTDKNANNLHIKKPLIYVPDAQKNGKCWHVPYVSDDFIYADLHEFPNKWYCLRRSRSD